MWPKILFAEDHPFLVDYVKLIFESEGISGVVEVSTRVELLRQLEGGDFTHLILDLMLDDGDAEAALHLICSRYPKLHILVYSSQPSIPFGETIKQKYAIECYISKSEHRATQRKEFLVFLKTGGVTTKRSTGDDNPFKKLSPREKDVLPYILKGMPATKIALEFKAKFNLKDMSADTIRTWKGRILKKTRTSNILQLRDLARIHNAG